MIQLNKYRVPGYRLQTLAPIVPSTAFAYAYSHHRNRGPDPDLWHLLAQPTRQTTERLKTPRVHPQPTNALTLHAPVSPQLPERLRGLVNAAYAAHGGAEHMKLNDWRDLELELKRRLENEDQKCQR